MKGLVQGILYQGTAQAQQCRDPFDHKGVDTRASQPNYYNWKREKRTGGESSLPPAFQSLMSMLLLVMLMMMLMLMLMMMMMMMMMVLSPAMWPIQLPIIRENLFTHHLDVLTE